jgi:hypothetical protein
MKHFLRISFLSLLSPWLTACEQVPRKRDQTISFPDIPPQNFIDRSFTLSASASSGLPVYFTSSDSHIVDIQGDTARFLAIGSVYIAARQDGNEDFYEAPYIVRELHIRDWDPNKLSQTISFELPPSRSNDDPPLLLVATASSGLPVSFTSNDRKGQITDDNYLILYHGPYQYEFYLTVTASQSGNDLYNPAGNVARTLHAIGDGTH